MRNKMLLTVTLLATVFSPTVTVAEPGIQAKKTVSDEYIVENIKATMESSVGPTKEEIVAKKIEANLQKIKELEKARKAKIAAEKARKAALAARAYTTITVRTTAGNADAIAYGKKRNAAVFGEAHWSALYRLWSKESGWRDTALNRSSGACGIPQFINGCVLGDHVSQIDQGLVYISRRYGNPTNAWNFWLRNNWY